MDNENQSTRRDSPSHAADAPLGLDNWADHEVLAEDGEPLMFVAGRGDRLYFGFASGSRPDGRDRPTHFAFPMTPETLLAFRDGEITLGDAAALAGGSAIYTDDNFRTSYRVATSDMHEHDASVLSSTWPDLAPAGSEMTLPR